MKKLNILVAAALALAGSSAMAQKAGTWSASVGFTSLQPQVSSGQLSAPALPNTRVDIQNSTQLTGAINYAITDNIVAHVPLGFGFKHDIVGAGNPLIAAAGKLGDVRVLPVTAIAQYRFMDAGGAFRPYVGAGLTYAKFFKEQGTAALTAATNPGSTGTTLSVESKLAPTIQLGTTFNINEKWYVDGSYTKTFLSTTTRLSTNQTIDTKLNPNGFTFQVGYKF